jgi:putative peptidoglycan lipid II flippase
MAVQAAALPVLSRLAARQDYPALQQTLNHGVRLSLFVGLPASLALMVLAEPLVTLIYQRGHFDSLASVETASALRAQASGIWAVAVARQLVVGCYALGNTRAPVWISALDFVVFVAVALGLMGSLGHSAVGWAMSVSSVVQVLLLGWVLRQQLGSLDVATTLRAAAKVGVASTAAGAAGYGVIALLRDATLWGWTFGSSSGLLAGLGLLVFGLVFLAFAVGLRCGELRVMTSALSRRLAPRS